MSVTGTGSGNNRTLRIFTCMHDKIFSVYYTMFYVIMTSLYEYHALLEHDAGATDSELQENASRGLTSSVTVAAIVLDAPGDKGNTMSHMLYISHRRHASTSQFSKNTMICNQNGKNRFIEKGYLCSNSFVHATNIWHTGG